MGTGATMRSYSELQTIHGFRERFEYLKLNGAVGKETFGFERYLNQRFYQSPEWRRLRNEIIARDLGCDLGCEGFELHGKVYIHHMNPIQTADIVEARDILTDPENLITVSFETHQAIHYGDANQLAALPVERTAGDTCPWKHI